MFQLIVTVISIALVASLAVASVFYAGKAFTDASVRSTANGVMNQAQQIVAAIKLYELEKRALPADLNALVTNGYLAHLPEPPEGAQTGGAFDGNGDPMDANNGLWKLGPPRDGNGDPFTSPAVGLRILTLTVEDAVCQRLRVGVTYVDSTAATEKPGPYQCYRFADGNGDPMATDTGDPVYLFAFAF